MVQIQKMSLRMHLLASTMKIKVRVTRNVFYLCFADPTERCDDGYWLQSISTELLEILQFSQYFN